LPTSTTYQADVILPSVATAMTTDERWPNWKYRAEIASGDNIYLIPTSENHIGKYNPNTDTFSKIDMTAYRDYLLQDGSVFREPITNSMSTGYALATWMPADANFLNNDQVKYVSAVLAPNGIICCLPFPAGSIGMIDTTTDTFSVILAVKNSLEITKVFPAQANLDIGAVMAPNGFIYMFIDDKYRRIDPTTNIVEAKVYMTPPPDLARPDLDNLAYSNNHKSVVLGPGDKVYLIPNTKNIGVFDTNIHVYSEIDINGALTGLPISFWNGVWHPNDKIYLVPYWDVSWIGVIDTLTNSFSHVDISTIFPWTEGGTSAETFMFPGNRNKYNTATVGGDNKVYFLSSRALQVMVYDPVTGVAELILDSQNIEPDSFNSPSSQGFLESEEQWSDGVMFEKKMYLIPSNKGGIKVLGFGCCESCPPPPNIEANRANMVDARLKLIDELISQQYLNEQSSPALLIEGVKQYPIDLVTPLIEDPSSPLFMQSLWRIVLRAPDVHLNLAEIAQGTIFDDTATWARVFADSDKYMVNEVGQCANDRARSCDAGNPSCLNAAACITDRGDFTLNKLDAGGVTAPLQVESSGMEVLSVDYDITQSAFSVCMQYNDEVPGVIDAVFLSHMGVDQNPLLLPTFRSDEFPCLPLGTQQFQNQRDNSGMRHFFRGFSALFFVCLRFVVKKERW